MTAFFKEAVSLWGLGSYALFLGLLLVGGTSLEQTSAGIAPLSSGGLGRPLSLLGGNARTGA